MIKNIPQHKIKIQHETFGEILNETFVDGVQFKLFLKMVKGCIETKENLEYFNGNDFLLHIPNKYLVSSVIVTSVDYYSMAEHMIQKSKMEAPETR